jgi:FtsP/CotA-like multicopper oxidase with cupredoxin domain
MTVRPIARNLNTALSLQTGVMMEASVLTRVAAAIAVLVAALAMNSTVAAKSDQAPGQVRRYFIAADELDWDYMPGGRDGMMGMAPEGYAKFYATRGPHLVGPVYRKALYREYTDASFSRLKPHSPGEAYLGALGPVIHAEVGDTIRVTFRNNGTHPYSMHPHGVFYDKASEGSPYADGIAPAKKPGDSVAPSNMSGKCRNVRARDRTIPARSSGSITPTRASGKM